MSDNNKLQSPAAIKLASIKDLVKMMIFSAGSERSAGYVGYFRDNDKSLYFIFNTSLGYYELNALPFVIWVEDSKELENPFIRYRTSPAEEMEFTDFAADPKWVTLPVIAFEEMPEFLKVWKKKE
ncbi:MAG: hypothetical protein KGD64_04220 [Candidatus Heimdallarchaeota archaeon]|nr:hypothetical protein [Candidatus Heimdallarchaeota archaeon]